MVPFLCGAAGVVRSTSDNRWLEPTTPSAPAKEASRHFLNGRSHPSFPRRGVRLSLQFSISLVSSNKMWDMLTLQRRGNMRRNEIASRGLRFQNFVDTYPRFALTYRLSQA